MASSSAQPVKVAPSILIWARESLGLSYADVAKKLKKDESLVRGWETGELLPTYSQLEKLAYQIYKRPLVVFFLPEPPKETTPEQDFRTLADSDISTLSPPLRLAIRKAKHHQVALKELHPEGNPSEKQIHKELSFKLRLNVKEAADMVRSYFGFDTKRKSFTQKRQAFDYYRLLIEQSGVFVFQQPLTDVRGFSLMDKEFPVIVISSADSPSARTFTLFHELCHILFNTGGIFRDFITKKLKMASDSIEQFCNAFASEFLVPSQELSVLLKSFQHIGPDWPEMEIRSLAATFSVSKEVILRRILDLGLTDRKYYVKMANQWNEKYFREKEERKKKKTAIPYQTIIISQLGKKFIYDILNNYHSGRIDASQASTFLGVKIGQISKIENKLQ